MEAWEILWLYNNRRRASFGNVAWTTFPSPNLRGLHDHPRPSFKERTLPEGVVQLKRPREQEQAYLISATTINMAADTQQHAGAFNVTSDHGVMKSCTTRLQSPTNNILGDQQWSGLCGVGTKGTRGGKGLKADSERIFFGSVYRTYVAELDPDLRNIQSRVKNIIPFLIRYDDIANCVPRTFDGSSFCYRASACNACRARYCYSKSVRPSVCQSSAGIVSKRTDVSPNFLTIWQGYRSSFLIHSAFTKF